MKHPILALFFLVLSAVNQSACNRSDQNEAVEQAKKIEAAVQQNRPGTIPTGNSGYIMRAKLDGKNWVATSMMPPEEAGRLIGYLKDEYIGLPYDRRYLEVGKKIKFGEHQAVDLMTDDEIAIWGGTKGEMTVTKVDDNSAEGTFFFTASASGTDKTIEVTEGYFQIPLAKNR